MCCFSFDRLVRHCPPLVWEGAPDVRRRWGHRSFHCSRGPRRPVAVRRRRWVAVRSNPCRQETVPLRLRRQRTFRPSRPSARSSARVGPARPDPRRSAQRPGTTTARLPVRGTGPDCAWTRADVTGTPEGSPPRHPSAVRDEPRPVQRLALSVRRVRRTGCFSVGGLVGVDDAGRDPAAVADGVPVLAGPVPDGAGLLTVHATTGGAAAAATGRTGAATHLAGGRDITGEGVTHLLGV